MNQEEKRRLDRNRARNWLAQDPLRMVQVLRLAFRLEDGMTAELGMRGSLGHLSVLNREKKFLPQSVAGLLFGDGFVTAVHKPSTGKPAKRRREFDPIPLGPVQLARPGLKLLKEAGHPVVDVPHAGKRPSAASPVSGDGGAP